MKMKKYLFVIISLLYLCLGCSAANRAKVSDSDQNNQKMQWWKDAKFGMFIHWGIYSVPAGKWDTKTTYGEWIMHQASLSIDTYANFATQFNPTKFNAEDWVKLAKAAGQKYIVITSKHHDGFAMFKSDASPYNIVDATPFKRDVVAELAAACRKYGMKLGLYYSQAQDWHHPGGARSGNKLWDNGQKGDMMEYIKKIAVPQVKEILSKYGDIAVLWWDTPYNMTPEMGKLLNDVVKQYPNLITNNRLGGGFSGDLETPEQFIPATGFPGRNWEVCMTMNGHWGYNAYDDNWKSTRELLRKLIDINSKGGNFLLNVGPNQYGVIPEVCQNELREIGAWLDDNGEAIYGSTASPFPYLSWGRATCKGNKLYLFVFDWPKNRKLAVPLMSSVKKAYLLADRNTSLKIQKNADGIDLDLPAYAPDHNASVIALELNGKPVVEPLPSKGCPVTASSSKTAGMEKLLTDGDIKTTWAAADDTHRAELVMDLGEKFNIKAISMEEPWSQWAGVHQKYELQAWKGGKWISVKTGTTPGCGITEDIPVTNAQKFRLILNNDQKTPSLKEWILYR